MGQRPNFGGRQRPTANVDQFVQRGVAPKGDLAVRQLVLGQDSFDLVRLQIGQGDRVGYRDAALLALLDEDVGRLLVEPDAKALELALDDLLVFEGLEDVQHYEEEIAGPGHRDDLTTTTFAVLGAFNDLGRVSECPT
jgi:hypothetical protein